MQKINRIIALVHPTFSTDENIFLHEGEEEDWDSQIDEVMRADALWEKWMERARTMRDDEIMIVFAHPDDFGELKHDIRDVYYYPEKIRELKKEFGKRIIVLTAATTPYEPNRPDENRSHYETLLRIINARGFTFDPKDVVLETCGMSIDLCVPDVAEYMHEAGKFTEQGVITVALTNGSHMSDHEIAAKNAELGPEARYRFER